MIAGVRRDSQYGPKITEISPSAGADDQFTEWAQVAAYYRDHWFVIKVTFYLTFS